MRMFVMTILCAVSSCLLPGAGFAQAPYYYFDEPIPLGENPYELAVHDRARGTMEPLRNLFADAGVRESAIEYHPVAGWFTVRIDTESGVPLAMPDLVERLAVHDLAGRYLFSGVARERKSSEFRLGSQHAPES